MPRYLFHINGTDPQPIAGDLADIASAKRETAKTIGAILCDAGSCVWNGDDWSIDVTDENGLKLFTVIVAAYDAPAISRASLPA